MTFFSRVVASFDDISTDDLKLLDLISAELGLDNEECQEAKRKCLPLDKTEESGPFALLGISNTLSAQEKKDKLGKIYEKWINATTHNNPEMRKKAEMMVNTIAECRKNISLH